MSFLCCPSSDVKRILSALELPPAVVSLTLNFVVGEVVFANVEMLVSEDAGEELESVFANYRLEKTHPSAIDCWHPI